MKTMTESIFIREIPCLMKMAWWTSITRDYLGSLRVSYDEVSSETTLEYTIIGQQKDGKLTKAEGLDMTPALSGHLTVEQMLEKKRIRHKDGCDCCICDCSYSGRCRRFTDRPQWKKEKLIRTSLR